MAFVPPKRTRMNFSLRYLSFTPLTSSGADFWLTPLETHAQMCYEAPSTVESPKTRVISTWESHFKCVTKWSKKLTNWFVSALEIPGICVSPLRATESRVLCLMIATTAERFKHKLTLCYASRGIQTASLWDMFVVPEWPMYSQVFCSPFFAVGSGSSIDFIDVSRSTMTTPAAWKRVRVVCWVIWLQGLTFPGNFAQRNRKLCEETLLVKKKVPKPCHLTESDPKMPSLRREHHRMTNLILDDTGSRITETQFALLLMLCGERWQNCGLCVFKKIFLSTFFAWIWICFVRPSIHACTLDSDIFIPPFCPN